MYRAHCSNPPSGNRWHNELRWHQEPSGGIQMHSGATQEHMGDNVLPHTSMASGMLKRYQMHKPRTTAAGMMASQTTDLPRPSIQFTAVGFLSAQKLPEMLSRRM